LFNELQALAEKVPQHYTPNHAPILAPTGRPIPPWKAQ
jgi:hypothetical protein